MQTFSNTRIIGNSAIYLSLHPDNNYAEITNLSTNQKRAYTMPSGIQDIFSSMYNFDRVLLIGALDEVLVVSLVDGNTIFKKFDESVSDIAFLNASNQIHYKTDRDTVIIMSSDLSEQILEVPHMGELFQTRPQHSEKYVFCEPIHGKSIQLWDIGLRKLVFERTFPDELILGYELSQDRKRIIVTTDKVIAKVFNLKTGQLINTVEIPVKTAAQVWLDQIVKTRCKK